MASYSSNGGNTWSAPEKIVQSAPDLPAAVPDLIQLSDGTILVGYNPRPSKPYSTERRFGIRLVRSTDNGKTWSDSIFVYDASHTFEDGCWEPSFNSLRERFIFILQMKHLSPHLMSKRFHCVAVLTEE